MKGLNEETRASDSPKPEGGKVLQRLKLFLEERNLDETVSDIEEPTEPAKKKKSRSKADQSTTYSNEDYAQACIDAYNVLEAASHVDPNLAIENDAETIAMSPPTSAGPNWQALGPWGMANGQTYGDTRIEVSGRVSCIAIDPSNANHILLGAAGGGVWESFNKGVNFAPRSDYMPSLAIGAIAFNPVSTNIVYCGTGEGNFYSTLGAGVMKSINGGTTWSMVATTPFVGKGFYDLIVDPANPNHLIAATTAGIYTSTDEGINWTLRRSGKCWSLSIHPSGGTNEMLAAVSTGIVRSVDGGITWTAVAIPGAPISWNRIAVQISRSNPTIAYAFGSNGTSAFLYQRVNAVWFPVTLPAGVNVGQDWYDWFLGVAPDNASQVYIGTIEAFRGTLSGATWTWLRISNKSGQDIHPDQHAIAISQTNPNEIYVGCDGGLYYSPDRGVSWLSRNGTLGITEIEYMGQDYGDIRFLIAGTQDNGTVRYNGSYAWEHIADGDGGDCGVHRANPNIVFHTYYNMGIEKSTARGNFGSWANVSPTLPSGYNSLFYPPTEVCNNTIAQAGQSVFISRNQGAAWTNVAFPASLMASALYIPNPDQVFVGTTSGRVFRISWNGASWAITELSSPRPGARISDIHVMASNLNQIWVTYTSMGLGGRAFRSVDGGTTWANLTVGLPNLPINAVEVDPGNFNRVWVAADVGVYQSFNGGSTWAPFSNGLPNSLAVDLLYNPHARILRVGLRNRGVYQIHVDGPLANPICGVQWTGTLAANQTQKWFTFNWPATWHVLWTVMPTTAIPGAPEISWDVFVERASAEYVTYWIEVKNRTAQTVNFEGRYAILSFA